MATITITSCRDCEHFNPGERTTCEFYDRCKAGRPLGETPCCFSPKMKSR